MNIPLTNMFIVVLSLVITLCSANSNSRSKPRDNKVSYICTKLSFACCLCQNYVHNTLLFDFIPFTLGPRQTSSYRYCAPSACFCTPGIPGIPGSPGPAGPVGIAGSPGSHGPEGHIRPRGVKGDEGLRGRQGLRGPKGPQGPSGTPGNKGEPGARRSQGPQSPTGLLGKKGEAGARGSQGPPGLQGPPGSFVHNWKQCVFRGLSEGKDSELIKVTNKPAVSHNDKP